MSTNCTTADEAKGVQFFTEVCETAGELDYLTGMHSFLVFWLVRSGGPWFNVGGRNGYRFDVTSTYRRTSALNLTLKVGNSSLL